MLCLHSNFLILCVTIFLFVSDGQAERRSLQTDEKFLEKAPVQLTGAMLALKKVTSLKATTAAAVPLVVATMKKKKGAVGALPVFATTLKDSNYPIDQTNKCPIMVEAMVMDGSGNSVASHSIAVIPGKKLPTLPFEDPCKGDDRCDEHWSITTGRSSRNSRCVPNNLNPEAEVCLIRYNADAGAWQYYQAYTRDVWVDQLIGEDQSYPYNNTNADPAVFNPLSGQPLSAFFMFRLFPAVIQFAAPDSVPLCTMSVSEKSLRSLSPLPSWVPSTDSCDPTAIAAIASLPTLTLNVQALCDVVYEPANAQGCLGIAGIGLCAIYFATEIDGSTANPGWLLRCTDDALNAPAGGDYFRQPPFATPFFGESMGIAWEAGPATHFAVLGVTPAPDGCPRL
eukprot:GHVS01088231.1.p1 GENE.GHVS01088231.1~~GHVS01088231.1.p1  ORF type:complete len:396 (+),score=59.97 GHVS01088231.1:135-1322(+)